MTTRHIQLHSGTRPILPRHVLLKFDKLRGRWLLLAPERVLVPDAISVEVLQMCDGKASIAVLVAELSTKYDAPAEQITRDVLLMLQDLADKGFLGEMKEAII